MEITERWLRGETVDWSQVTPRYRTVFLPGYRFRRSIMTLEAPSEVTADGALTDLDAIEVEILASLRRVLGGLAGGFDVHSEFADFGIDSIQVSRIHADLSRRVPALEVFAIYEHNSVAKLARHIARELGISIGSPSTSRSAEPPDAGKAGVRRVDRAEPVGLLDYASDAEQLVSARDLVARHRELGAEHPLRILNVPARGGRTMEIVVAGRGRPLFLLPPFNSTAAIWLQQLLELGDHFQMFAVNYPGLGASEWIDEMHSFEDLASVLTEVIDGLHDDGVLPNRRVDCVGWSFGGFLAQTMARFHPDHVGRLVLLSTTSISWSSEEYTISAEEFSRKSAQEFRDNQAKLPPLIRGLPKVARLRDAGSIERFVLGTVERRVIDRYFVMIARFPHHETARCLAGDIHLISGADDELMPPRFARELASMIDGATYHEVPGGRHFLALFEKETINQMLVAWLGDSDPRRDQDGRCRPGAES